MQTTDHPLDVDVLKLRNACTLCSKSTSQQSTLHYPCTEHPVNQCTTLYQCNSQSNSQLLNWTNAERKHRPKHNDDENTIKCDCPMKCATKDDRHEARQRPIMQSNTQPVQHNLHSIIGKCRSNLSDCALWQYGILLSVILNCISICRMLHTHRRACRLIQLSISQLLSFLYDPTPSPEPITKNTVISCGFPRMLIIAVIAPVVPLLVTRI